MYGTETRVCLAVCLSGSVVCLAGSVACVYLAELCVCSWEYCVLDEGHVIRNPTSGVSRAAKALTAEHRLILSGTRLRFIHFICHNPAIRGISIRVSILVFLFVPVVTSNIYCYNIVHLIWYV